MTDPRQHPEYVALLEAIRENPEDDAPRLIISDWLEEQGADDLAQEIRRQVGRGPGWFGFLARRDWIELPDGVKVDGTESRGFVCEVRLTGDQFMAHAEWLFRQFPLTRVTLADRRPITVHTTGTIPKFWWLSAGTTRIHGEPLTSSAKDAILPAVFFRCRRPRHVPVRPRRDGGLVRPVRRLRPPARRAIAVAISLDD